MRLGEVTFDPAMRPSSQFMLGEGREEASRGSTITIGLFGKLRPQRFDRRQPELLEHDAEAGFVYGVVNVHATSPA
jgi:hypothetical protein